MKKLKKQTNIIGLSVGECADMWDSLTIEQQTKVLDTYSKAWDKFIERMNELY